MSMVLQGVTLTVEQAETLSSRPEMIEELLFGDLDDLDDGDDRDDLIDLDDRDEDGRDGEGPATVDLDKAWHGIHFLLTGTAEDTSSVLGQAVLGGRPIGPDLGYGPARLLDADEVRAVAAALTAVDTERLRQGFDAAAFEKHDIYPDIWQTDDVLDDYLLPSLYRLMAFYYAAAATGSAVVLSLT